MMKKQTKTYLLIAAVAIVWGMIGYRIYQHFTPEEIESQSITPQVFHFKNNPKKVYTFQQLQRDPFTGKILIKKKITKPKKVVIPKPKKEVVFPKVEYQGFVEGVSSSFVLRINGVHHVLNLDDTTNGVRLIKGDTSQIVIEYQKERKTIPIKD